MRERIDFVTALNLIYNIEKYSAFPPARLSLTHQYSESESRLTLALTGARVCARVTNTWVTSMENTSWITGEWWDRSEQRYRRQRNLSAAQA